MKTKIRKENWKLIIILLTVVFGIATIPACTVEAVDSDVCNPQCVNGGSCEEGQCVCPTGFSGVSCEIEEECGNPNYVCDYDGTCVNGACACSAFTQVYAIGIWDFNGNIVDLEFTSSQAIFTDPNGTQSSNVSYGNDTIFLLDFNSYMVPSNSTMTCSSVTVDEYFVGTNTFLNTYTLVRQ